MNPSIPFLCKVIVWESPAGGVKRSPSQLIARHVGRQDLNKPHFMNPDTSAKPPNVANYYHHLAYRIGYVLLLKTVGLG